MCDSGKREDYIEWEDYFMALAMVASMRSKDPECQVGACIANSDNVVVGMGYNGFPYGCSDDKFSWIKEENSMNNKHLYGSYHGVVHRRTLPSPPQ